MARVPDNGIAENFFRRDGRLNPIVGVSSSAVF